MTETVRKRKYDNVFLILGAVAVTLSFFPYIFLQEGAAINYFDQLDGELFAYIFKAQYFFQPGAFIEQVLSGAAQTAYTPPAPLFVLFFLFMPPFLAYLATKYVVMIVAYLGMYLFLNKVVIEGKEITSKEITSKGNTSKGNISKEEPGSGDSEKLTYTLFWKLTIAIVALCFAFLPHLYLYGLCVAGQPFIFLVFYNLYSNKKVKLNLLFVILFALSSSLVLIGYGNLMIFTLIYLALLIRKETIAEVNESRKILERFKKYKSFLFGIFVMTTTYFLLNLDLIKTFTDGKTQEISHKTEYVIKATPFFDQVYSLFVNGIFHCASLHTIFIVPLMAILITSVIKYKKLSFLQKYLVKILWGLLFATILITIFYGLWHVEFIVELRKNLGGPFVYFQLDRFYWLYPFLWYSMLGIGALVFMEYRNKVVSFIVFLLLFVVSGNVLWKSDFKCNIRQLVNEDTSTQATWEDYYASDLMSEIRDYIGLPQESYRVVSLGMHPAAALYNGFYCIDGYSNNYSLEYKHKFRSVMEDELEKNAYNQEAFDQWGNRCYLMTNQLGQSFMIGKSWNVVAREPIALNVKVLQELNCQYLFSAVEITDYQNSGLEYLKSFTSQGSFYTVYLYKITWEEEPL